MRRLSSCVGFILLLVLFTNSTLASCANKRGIFKPLCQRFHHIWYDGSNELYFSGYAWHNRYTYRPEKIQRYNELAWGGGIGKGVYGPKNDWQGIYAIAFLDSHKNVEPAIGYAYLKVAHFTPNLIAGIGYSVLVTMREDINHGYPFPGILPWTAITYRKISLCATYIPGAAGAGNVLYVVAKYTF